MKITWAKSDQHTEWGLFRVGDVIDTIALGIPGEVISSWIKDGYAVPEIAAEKPDKPRKIKRIGG